MSTPTEALNMIGAYGPWATDLLGEGPARLSFRQPHWQEIDAWRAASRGRLRECLASPPLPPTPTVECLEMTTYEGLHIERLRWQLPYGPPTEAVLLKPEGARKPLPGVLGLHCHGGVKFFGKDKITRFGEAQHPMMRAHQAQYYDGVAWANELAKRGYVVLAHDAFPFASRRVRLRDVPQAMRNGLDDPDLADLAGITAYNQWAAQHESVMAKSLFCAGTTWPGVFLNEDRVALGVLCARPEVDAARVGCAGLSGGGMRTTFLAGADDRIACAVCVGMMTTWRDYMLHKAFTHTWMVYVPLLPRELDYPEILGLRAPRPTLVLNDRDDDLFTLPEMQRAGRILAEVYAKAGATERYRCSYYDGPHKFDREMQSEAFAWFDRWLKL
jgi:dienelactone hydrolase